MTDEIRIGATLYRFDFNRRVYQRSPDGRTNGPPIYAEHFERGEVIGETPRSWICSLKGWGEFKVNKKTMLESGKGYSPFRWYTEGERADEIWLKENRHALSARIANCRSVAALKAVALALDIHEGVVIPRG